MTDKRRVCHVLLALPEESVESLVGEQEGSERDMICLEDDPDLCPRPALSLLVCAASSNEAEQIALTFARDYGVTGGVWTLATDLTDHIDLLQERGEIPAYLEPGVLCEYDCLFAVSEDPEVQKRAAEFIVQGIISGEDE